MSNPTLGTLRLSSGLELDRCNPSFIWSDDSRYLAVPRYFHRFGIFRRQRMVVIDTLERRLFASPDTTYYFQPDSFSEGRLVCTKNPFRSTKQIAWHIPEDLGRFKPLAVSWAKTS